MKKRLIGSNAVMFGGIAIAIKRIIALCIVLLVSFNLCAKNMDNPKILIVYYSWSSNTRAMANEIKSIVGGDIFEIKPVKPYPTEYKKCTEQAKDEINKKFRPKIVGEVKDFQKYDVIFIGSPNWWGTIAPPVGTFLTDYNFSGKKVIPFCTHGGGGEQDVFTDMKKMLPNSDVLQGLEVYCKYEKGLPVMGGSSYNSENAVEKWIKELNILNKK